MSLSPGAEEDPESNRVRFDLLALLFIRLGPGGSGADRLRAHLPALVSGNCSTSIVRISFQAPVTFVTSLSTPSQRSPGHLCKKPVPIKVITSHCLLELIISILDFHQVPFITAYIFSTLTRFFPPSILKDLIPIS